MIFIINTELKRSLDDHLPAAETPDNRTAAPGEEIMRLLICTLITRRR